MNEGPPHYLYCFDCCQVLKDPVTIPGCGHTFCEDCVRKIPETVIEGENMHISVQKTCVQCDLTFKPSHILPNWAARHGLDAYFKKNNIDKTSVRFPRISRDLIAPKYEQEQEQEHPHMNNNDNNDLENNMNDVDSNTNEDDDVGVGDMCVDDVRDDVNAMFNNDTPSQSKNNSKRHDDNNNNRYDTQSQAVREVIASSLLNNNNNNNNNNHHKSNNMNISTLSLPQRPHQTQPSSLFQWSSVAPKQSLFTTTKAYRYQDTYGDSAVKKRQQTHNTSTHNSNTRVSNSGLGSHPRPPSHNNNTQTQTDTVDSVPNVNDVGAVTASVNVLIEDEVSVLSRAVRNNDQNNHKVNILDHRPFYNLDDISRNNGGGDVVSRRRPDAGNSYTGNVGGGVGYNGVLQGHIQRSLNQSNIPINSNNNSQSNSSYLNANTNTNTNNVNNRNVRNTPQSRQRESDTMSVTPSGMSVTPSRVTVSRESQRSAWGNNIINNNNNVHTNNNNTNNMGSHSVGVGSNPSQYSSSRTSTRISTRTPSKTPIKVNSYVGNYNTNGYSSGGIGTDPVKRRVNSALKNDALKNSALNADERYSVIRGAVGLDQIDVLSDQINRSQSAQKRSAHVNKQWRK